MQQPSKIMIRTIDGGDAGSLSVVESSLDLPFPIRRAYYLHGMKQEVRRGFHAHKRLHQCLIALNGTCELTLEGPAGHFCFALDRPDEGVLIPPGYWREMNRLTPDSLIMVLASMDYDETDYIRDYGEFKAWLADRKPLRTPYLDLTRGEISMKKRLEEAFAQVQENGCFINGPFLRRFEDEFARNCQTACAVGVANGLDALTLILMALGIGPGDEVVVCAAGFAATALAVQRVGAELVFADCLPFGNIDPASVEKVVTERTRAVIPTHLYGFPADMPRLAELCEKKGLHLIEDACQAHGASLNGRPCGSWGVAAAFSFYPTKNLGALGDGGCVSTSDQELAGKIRVLSNYGAPEKYRHELQGLNSRLDELQAALLLVKLPFLNQWNNDRKRKTAIYGEGLKTLEQMGLLALPQEAAHSLSSWHTYTARIRHGRRDDLAGFLAGRGIGSNVHYPVPLHKQPYCRAQYEQCGFLEAESWADEVLSLPWSQDHTLEELKLVVETIKAFFAGGETR